MGEFRKQWPWPDGLAQRVYGKIISWSKNYNTTGRIFKARATANARFGMELPDTEVLIRMHELTFTYPELKWLNSILQIEDPNTRQAFIFQKAVELFEEKEQQGRATTGMSLPFEMAFTEDEVNYVRKLLECFWPGQRRLTPSEVAEQQKQLKDGKW